MNEFDILTGFSGADLMQKMPQNIGQKSYVDNRFWKLSKNKEGNGAAMIRLITDRNKVPFVCVYHYNSKKNVGGKDRWLIANSPSTIGLPCPIQEEYFEVLNSGDEKLARSLYGRKVKYYTNILVVKDPANPENEGKVFLFEFGSKLKEKFLAWINPDETQRSLGHTEKELYNPINGYNIELTIKKDPQSGFFNYDNTSLAPSPSKLGGLEKNEDIIDIILNKTYDLSEFTKPEYFPSYEELKEKLERFKNPFGTKTSSVPSVVGKTNDNPPFETQESKPQSQQQVVQQQKPKQENSQDDDWLNNL
ncbi:hypothetical protein [Campylobacter phage CP81]|uniref:Single-stranded DNA-binding protein n=3 Tax=Fletchervirus TaxID=1636618 RepID=G8GJ61_9CAUD|nr:putative ssDNA binding protein [Campylobacter phage CPX]YP_009623403.1 hypothetical protein FDJ37_gp138 [Campylobacter phage CP81]AGS81318.1 putative ssDNA binding protein [Campylobacter phage CP8]AVR55746.1 ssDNA binding protein [Campylobacter phage CP39]AET34446.1 putative ssDNA binding protein [Campylobacter phage CPX]CBZ42344.1 hypothetical protein [Campylobacter phage CP81]